MDRRSPQRTVPAESIRQWLDQALTGEDDRAVHATALALAEEAWSEPDTGRLRVNYVKSRVAAGQLGLDPRTFSVHVNSLRADGYLHRSRGRKRRPGWAILTTPASATPAQHTL